MLGPRLLPAERSNRDQARRTAVERVKKVEGWEELSQPRGPVQNNASDIRRLTRLLEERSLRNTLRPTERVVVDLLTSSIPCTLEKKLSESFGKYSRAVTSYALITTATKTSTDLNIVDKQVKLLAFN